MCLQWIVYFIRWLHTTWFSGNFSVSKKTLLLITSSVIERNLNNTSDYLPTCSSNNQCTTTIDRTVQQIINCRVGLLMRTRGEIVWQPEHVSCHSVVKHICFCTQWNARIRVYISVCIVYCQKISFLNQERETTTTTIRRRRPRPESVNRNTFCL